MHVVKRRVDEEGHEELSLWQVVTWGYIHIWELNTEDLCLLLCVHCTSVNKERIQTTPAVHFLTV